jgi:hypothetical protein
MPHEFYIGSGQFVLAEQMINPNSNPEDRPEEYFPSAPINLNSPQGNKQYAAKTQRIEDLLTRHQHQQRN